MVLVLPSADRVAERLFLAGNEQGVANRLRDEAAAAALIDQTFEIGEDLLGKRDVDAGCAFLMLRGASGHTPVA